jgi:hypothetical protein
MKDDEVAQASLDFLIAISIFALVLIFTISTIHDFRGSLISSSSEDLNYEAKKISYILTLSEEWTSEPYVLNSSKLEELKTMSYEDAKNIFKTQRNFHISLRDRNGSLLMLNGEPILDFGKTPSEYLEVGEWRTPVRILNETVIAKYNTSSLFLTLESPQEVVVEVSPLSPRPVKGYRIVEVNGISRNTTEETTFVLSSPTSLEINVQVNTQGPALSYLTEIRVKEYRNAILVVSVW